MQRGPKSPFDWREFKDAEGGNGGRVRAEFLGIKNAAIVRGDNGEVGGEEGEESISRHSL